jgi:hypothetical protein
VGPTLEQQVAPLEAAIVCPTTIGRQPQLASLSRLVDQLVDGRGNTVVLTGEAGIGKTRLAAEACTVAFGRRDLLSSSIGQSPTGRSPTCFAHM